MAELVWHEPRAGVKYRSQLEHRFLSPLFALKQCVTHALRRRNGSGFARIVYFHCQWTPTQLHQANIDFRKQLLERYCQAHIRASVYGIQIFEQELDRT